MNKKTILENFAKAYQAERFPPISGKIIGLFMITPERYLSFEEIQKELDISKSALSKNLKLLIDLNRITYVKDTENSRKRLFCIDIIGTKKHIYDIVKNFEFQNTLLEESKKIRTKNNDDDVANFIDNSIAFSKNIIKELNESIPKYFK
ncbi:hypothetical protein [Tenacibaculum finnmarkense]|uniref:hypothetical protein n=1 Tax=Tenacibaculum finnmarkense TaxID=2781243 RepID=UPI001E4E4125|nr:hypothetical protein [Tenacibaculum finnmarkense]MCD8410628.1 hypothetical protein [Tenacibaculum finnmarkense genomovar ulcerans]